MIIYQQLLFLFSLELISFNKYETFGKLFESNRWDLWINFPHWFWDMFNPQK